MSDSKPNIPCNCNKPIGAHEAMHHVWCASLRDAPVVEPEPSIIKPHTAACGWTWPGGRCVLPDGHEGFHAPVVEPVPILDTQGVGVEDSYPCEGCPDPGLPCLGCPVVEPEQPPFLGVPGSSRFIAPAEVSDAPERTLMPDLTCPRCGGRSRVREGWADCHFGCGHEWQVEPMREDIVTSEQIGSDVRESSHEPEQPTCHGWATGSDWCGEHARPVEQCKTTNLATTDAVIEAARAVHDWYFDEGMCCTGHLDEIVLCRKCRVMDALETALAKHTLDDRGND